MTLSWSGPTTRSAARILSPCRPRRCRCAAPSAAGRGVRRPVYYHPEAAALVAELVPGLRGERVLSGQDVPPSNRWHPQVTVAFSSPDQSTALLVDRLGDHLRSRPFTIDTRRWSSSPDRIARGSGAGRPRAAPNREQAAEDTEQLLRPRRRRAARPPRPTRRHARRRASMPAPDARWRSSASSPSACSTRTTRAAGHETTLDVIELGEQLGFDSAWVRHRHLQYGISSPIAVLAAATQRTRGSSSAPPSSRSAGRTRCGWPRTSPPSTSSPAAGSTPASASARRCTGTTSRPRSTPTPPTPRTSATSGSCGCCGSSAASRPAPSAAPRASRSCPTGSSRTHPACSDRLWYGGGSMRSAQWAGEHGMNFLTSNVVKAEDSSRLRRDPGRATSAPFRAAAPDGSARVSQGLVVIPTDSATAEQRAKYAAYVEARTPATASRRAPAAALRPRPARHLRADRRGPVRARRLPRGARGRLRAAVQLRARATTCRSSPTWRPPRPRARLEARSLMSSPRSTRICGYPWGTGSNLIEPGSFGEGVSVGRAPSTPRCRTARADRGTGSSRDSAVHA